MLKKINNLFLSLLSISWMILLYILDNMESIFDNSSIKTALLICFAFFIIQIIITSLELKWILPKYQKDNLIGVREVENMDGEFLPTYLGYFFIALGLDNPYIAITLFIIILIFVSLTRVQYYNPVFLVYKYHFYKVRTEVGVMLFLITKKEIRINEKIDFIDLRRINNYVYFDKEV